MKKKTDGMLALFFSFCLERKKMEQLKRARIIVIGEESPIAFVFLSGLGIFFLDKFYRASFLRVFYRAICRGGIFRY